MAGNNSTVAVVAPSASQAIASSLTSAIVSSITSQNAISTVTAPSQDPTTTFVSTSVVLQTTTGANGQMTNAPVTVVVTISSANTQPTAINSATTDTSSAAASASSSAALPNGNKASSNSGGLSAAGKTAVAVVVPVVVVALLVLAGLFFWRRRKQQKNAEDQRRKEMEDYGFNPNNDPTLPAVALADGSEMAEDQSGYRGWGNTTTAGAPTTRKTSTTLSGGLAGYSDNGSQPGGYHSPGSPTAPTVSDGNSGDALMGGRHETMDSETVGALGAGPAAGKTRGEIHRGPSNASSRYSTGAQSEHSNEPPIPMNNPQDYYGTNDYYTSSYNDNRYARDEQPVIRDVQARRNTRIENPSVYPQQGNMGIAQNF